MLLLILGSPKMVADLDEMDLDDIDKNSIASSNFVRKTSFMEHEVFKMVSASSTFYFLTFSRSDRSSNLSATSRSSNDLTCRWYTQ